MKRIRLVVLTLAAACALGGATASPSMAKCYRTYIVNTGNFTDSQCEVAGAGNYVKVVRLTNRIIGNIWCAEVDVNVTGYTDPQCNKPGTGKFILVVVPGPVWHHRMNSQEGAGQEIPASEPEEVQGSGGEQKLKGKIAGTEIELAGPQLQIKGIIYNNALQGQAKLTLVYISPRLVKPNFPNCVVTVGSNNVVKVYGHQAWTWDGSSQQLKQQKQQPSQKPDWIFLPGELQQEATALPKSTFTTISLKGAECGVLAGTVNVTGSAGAAIEPPGVEEWGTSETQKIIEGEGKQHFWNGKENIGTTTGTFLGGAPAVLSGGATVKVLPRQVKQAQQEIAHFEY